MVRKVLLQWGGQIGILSNYFNHLMFYYQVVGNLFVIFLSSIKVVEDLSKWWFHVTCEKGSLKARISYHRRILSLIFKSESKKRHLSHLLCHMLFNLSHQILADWLSASKNAQSKPSLNASRNLCGFPPDSNRWPLCWQAKIFEGVFVWLKLCTPRI